MKGRKKRILLVAVALALCLFAHTAISFGALVKHGQYNLPGATSIVGDFTIDGKQAFCIQHTKYSAPNGTAFTETLYDDPVFQKILYYGWGGPKQWSGFSSKEQGVVATSLVLSETYNAPAENGLYDYIPIVSNYKAFLAKQPVPADQSVTFSKTSVAAYYDKANNNQRTPTIKILGNANGKVTFTLPKGAFVKNVTKDATLSGKVTLPVGTEFFLFAKLGGVAGTYSTGTVGQTFRYQPMIYNFGSAYQQMGNYKIITDSGGSTSLFVDWIEPGHAKMTKSLEDIDGMDVGSLEGFRFIFSREGYPDVVSTTDEKGNFTATLWPGTYKITESSVPMEQIKIAGSKNVTIEEGKTVQIALKNHFKKGKLRVIKTQDFGDLIDGSTFLLESQSFTGYKKEFQVKNGELNVEGIPIGTYLLTETKTPDGHSVVKEVYEVEIKENQTTERIVVNRLAPRGELVVRKIDTESGDAIKDTQFTLTALDDIYSPITLKKIHSKGDILGIGSTDEEGTLRFTDLHMGKYRLTESKETPGYIPNQKAYDFELRQSDFETRLYTELAEIGNKKTTTEVSKKDVSTGDELPGASMKIIDRNSGDVVEEWISGEEPHTIRGLVYDKEYILREDLAPLGYYTAADVIFVAGSDAKVEMLDEPSKVLVSKVDGISGKEVSGAKLQIIQPETGKILKEWKSSEKPEMITGLEIGKKYVLTEVEAPEGYILSKEEIKFTVGEDKKVIMKNKPIIRDKAVKTGDPFYTGGILVLMLTAGFSVLAAFRRNRE
ncbi:MAG: SpaA isopeptide-forming pilin-related protein [Anaerovoracaceae bacterium]|jgi:uncharacterized surface anchored protein